jgi:hypothetical protein
LTAIWTPATYAINYAAGTANGNAVVDSLGLPTTAATAYGSTFTLGSVETTTITDNGLVYAFAGWKNGNQIYQISFADNHGHICANIYSRVAYAYMKLPTNSLVVTARSRRRCYVQLIMSKRLRQWYRQRADITLQDGMIRAAMQ